MFLANHVPPESASIQDVCKPQYAKYHGGVDQNTANELAKILNKVYVNPPVGYVKVEGYLDNLRFKNKWCDSYTIGDGFLKIRRVIYDIDFPDKKTYEYIQVSLNDQKYNDEYYANPDDINGAISAYLNEKSSKGIYKMQYDEEADGSIYDVSPASVFETFTKPGEIGLIDFINKVGPQWEHRYIVRTSVDDMNDMQTCLDLISYVPVAFIPAQGANAIIDFVRGNTKQLLVRSGVIVGSVVGGVIVYKVAGKLEARMLSCGTNTTAMRGIYEAVAEATADIENTLAVEPDAVFEYVTETTDVGDYIECKTTNGTTTDIPKSGLTSAQIQCLENGCFTGETLV